MSNQEKRKHIIHVNTNQLNIDGSVKLPSINDLSYGEIGINYRHGNETLSIKNDKNEIVNFVSTEQIKKEIEEIKDKIDIPEEVYIGDEIEGTPDLFVDTSSNDEIEVYTKEQVNILIKDLSDRVDEVTMPDTGVISINGETGIITGFVKEEKLQEEIDKVVEQIPDTTALVTKDELNQAIDNIEIPSIPEDLVNEEKLETEINKLIEQIPDTSNFATKEEIPVLPENIVNTVNGKTGDVVLDYVTPEELEKTELVVSESLNDLNQRIKNIIIPDTTGLASENYVDSKITRVEGLIPQPLIGGDNITISDNTINAKGYTTNLGGNSISVGVNNTITTAVNGMCSGKDNILKKPECNLLGVGLNSDYTQCVHVGRYNGALDWTTDNDNEDSIIFVIGNGYSDSSRQNLLLAQRKKVAIRTGEFGQNWIGDFAEYFEWEDGNVDNEDRIGYLVQLNGNKIEKANDFEKCIGVITSTNAVTIASCSFEWHDKYLKDEWSRLILDENNRPILNPEYDEKQVYTPRDKRKEWSPVGLLGQLLTRQDGTLEVGGFAGCKNGIATKANEGYRVMKIMSNEIALLLVK